MKKLFITAIISVFAAAALTVGVAATDFTVSPAATGEILGDANGDGSINARDILAIKRDVVGIEKAKVGADANGDSKINARDILAIKRQIVGIERLTDIKGSTVKILAVDGVNVKNMAIVAPEGTLKDSDNAALAASEMARYLSVVTGGSWDVDNSGREQSGPAIYIQYDPTIDWGEHGWDSHITPIVKHKFDDRINEVTPGQLGDEGFTIEVKDGNVYITGGRLRGCMYGVYQFLEDYVGVRFIEIDETYYYSADIVNIKSGINETVIPTFRYRHCDGFALPMESLPSYAFPRKLNAATMNGYDFQCYGYKVGNSFANAHSWGYYRADMRENPKWPDVSLAGIDLNWQPCFATQFDEMFEGMLAAADLVYKTKGESCIPGSYTMSFSAMDNWQFCTCDGCREIYERLGYSGACVDFASRAADEFQKYYPGIKIYTMTYDKTPPAEGLYVSENLVLMYCGTGCNNHIPGSGECGDNLTSIGTSNTADEESFAKWCEAVDEVYFWEYGVTCAYYMSPCPNVFNIFHDVKFVYENGGDGFYYEGDTADTYYSFERLKAYIAMRVMWDPAMTWEECQNLIEEYLFIRYGDSYEAIYELIEVLTECGDAAGCFINNHDRTWEMYDPATTAANFEKMLTLIEEAKTGARNQTQLDRIELNTIHVYFLGLAASYEDVYVNGTAEQKAEYEARYTYMIDFMHEKDVHIFYDDSRYHVPDTVDLTKSPMEQFYVYGTTP